MQQGVPLYTVHKTIFCGKLCFGKNILWQLKKTQTLAIPWTVVFQASLSMGFSRQEHWSGLSFPSPGNFPDPGIEPGSSTLRVDSLPTELRGKPHTHTHTHPPTHTHTHTHTQCLLATTVLPEFQSLLRGLGEADKGFWQSSCFKGCLIQTRNCFYRL